MKQWIAGYILIAIGAGLAVFAAPAWQNAPHGISVGEVDFAAWRTIFKAQALAYGAAAGLVIGPLLVVTAHFAPDAAKAPRSGHTSARAGIGLFGPWVIIPSGVAIAMGFPLLARRQLNSLPGQLGTPGVNPETLQIGTRRVLISTAIYAVPLLVAGLVLLRRALRGRAAER